jgi:hypothetical protein
MRFYRDRQQEDELRSAESEAGSRDWLGRYAPRRGTLDPLLDVLDQEPSFRGYAARKRMLAPLEIAGNEHEWIEEYRARAQAYRTAHTMQHSQ